MPSFFEKGEQGAAYSVPLHSAAAPKPLGDGSEGKLVQEFDSSENLQEIMGCWWQAYTEDRVMGRCPRDVAGGHISTESIGLKNGTSDMPPTAKARALLEAAKPDQERA